MIREAYTEAELDGHGAGGDVEQVAVGGERRDLREAIAVHDLLVVHRVVRLAHSVPDAHAYALQVRVTRFLLICTVTVARITVHSSRVVSCMSAR